MRKGISLIEVMVALIILSLLFSATFIILFASNRSWSTGQNKLIEQQEARRVMDDIVRLLRQTRPEWVSITSAGPEDYDKILFYEPVFDSSGAMSAGPWMIFKPDPDNFRRIIKKREGGGWIPVASEVERMKFFGGACSGCDCDFANASCSTCVSVTNECPLIKIVIESKKEAGFALSSFVSLRNNAGAGEIPEPPAEGEF